MRYNDLPFDVLPSRFYLTEPAVAWTHASYREVCNFDRNSVLFRLIENFK
jgi:hypothetical protein